MRSRSGSGSWSVVGGVASLAVSLGASLIGRLLTPGHPAPGDLADLVVDVGILALLLENRDGDLAVRPGRIEMPHPAEQHERLQLVAKQRERDVERRAR